MSWPQSAFEITLQSPPRMPAWIAATRAETAEDAAFLAGAALSALQLVLAQPGVPPALVRERRALGAAEASVIRAGRPERVANLRDEVHLLRPGDHTGPAGAVFALWREAVAKPIAVGTLHTVLPGMAAFDIATWLDTGQGAPVARACAVFEAVRTAHPRAEEAALILAEAVLAQAVGNKMIMPLLGAHLTARDLRKSGADLRGAGYAAVRKAAAETLMLSQDLRDRAAKLIAIAPKLRAKRTAAAVDLFLTRDALSPSLALTGPKVGMSDRAARRLCDRLVQLNVVRELSGRDTFRLYGTRNIIVTDLSDFDRDLEDLPAALRWREWMRRIEAVLFATASPVPRTQLARVVGQGASVDLLIDDLAADLADRSFEIAHVADGWMLRTRAGYSDVIRAAADVGSQALDLNEFDVAVLAAVAYYQPITRTGLKDIFGKEISRDLIGRLHALDLIATGPRAPRRGAPYTFVTTEQFLVHFGLESLRDLPDAEQLADAGIGPAGN